MGNRAIIKAEGGHIGLYLHWNGGRDSVEAFLKYCELRGFRSPEVDGYGWARLAQVIGNFFGGGLSLGIVETGSDEDGKFCDNGAYVIRDWKIIGRENFDGREQNEYDLMDMLQSIDEAQPGKEQIGAWLKAYEVPTADLKIGDAVVFIDWDGRLQSEKIVGFGKDRKVNGQDVKGRPYFDKFSKGYPEDNINNYIMTDTARKALETPTEPAKENPVEVFINEQFNGIEIKFKAKPTEEVRGALKEKGFRWHHKKAVWYAKRNPENETFAAEIAKAVTK